MDISLEAGGLFIALVQSTQAKISFWLQYGLRIAKHLLTPVGKSWKR
jgi:hypothetical protein